MFKRAGPDHFACIDKKDFVGILDGIEPVGDNHPGCIIRQMIKNILQYLFGDGIDVGSSLVQDEDFRLAQNSPHECNELSLAQTYTLPSGSNLRVQSLIKGTQDTLQTCFPDGFFQLAALLFVQAIPINNVFPDGS